MKKIANFFKLLSIAFCVFIVGILFFSSRTEASVQKEKVTLGEVANVFSHVYNDIGNKEQTTFRVQNSSVSLLQKYNMKMIEGYSVEEIQIPQNFSGYYIGVLDYLDPLEGKIEIDQISCPVTDDFEYNSVMDIWLNQDNKTVICVFSEGKITKMFSFLDVYDTTLSINTSPDSIIYENSTYANDTITIKAKLSSKIKSSYGLDASDLDNALGMKPDINKVSFDIKNNNLKFFDESSKLEKEISIPLGNTEIFSFQIKVNKEYIPEKINQNIKIDSSIEIGDGINITTDSFYVSIGNLDKQHEEASVKATDTKINKMISSTKNDLAKNVAVALDANILNYFSTNQKKEIEQYLTIWLSEIIAAESFKSKDLTDELQSKLKDSIFKKMGISTNTFLLFKKSRASTTVCGETLLNGERKIRFSVELENYGLDDDSIAFASFGKIEYEIMNKSGIKDTPTSGSGMITFANIQTFAEQVKSIADNAISDTYQEIWGRDVKKVAGIFVNTPIEKMLSGKFVDNVYTLLKKPTELYVKKISVKCPVDVYIYNWDGELCGEIIDNKINSSYADIFCCVDGDNKYIYLTGMDYFVKLVGTDTGTMDFEIEEYENGQSVRTLVTEEVALSKGIEYYTIFSEKSVDTDLAALTDADSEPIYIDKDTKKWDGSIALEFASGDGTSQNPYVISNGSELAKLAEDVIQGNSYQDNYFVLSKDIDLDERRWSPIGYWSTENDYSYFKGKFDGQNHIIKNCYISSRFGGIFGEIESAEIKNLNVENATYYYDVPYGTTAYIGGIIGYVESNCQISNCTYNGIIKPSDYYQNGTVGGIAGFVEESSIVSDCANYGNIHEAVGTAGGIAGANGGTVKDCINKGCLKSGTEDLGGIVGRVFGESALVISCINYSGFENSSSNAGRELGGIVGSFGNGQVLECRNEGNILNVSSIFGIDCGGIVGEIVMGKISRCENLGKITSIDSISGGICGCSYSGTSAGTIADCVNYADVTGGVVGGIFGAGYADIINCYNKGNINSNKLERTYLSTDAGGILGSGVSNIYNCYNIGNVNSSEVESNIGGIVGCISERTGSNEKFSSKIYNSYSTGQVSGMGNIGLLFGYIANYKVEIENCFHNAESDAHNPTGKKDYNLSVYNIEKIESMDILCQALNCWLLTHQNIYEYCFWINDNSKEINMGYPYFWKGKTENNIRFQENSLQLTVDQNIQLSLISDGDIDREKLFWVSSDRDVIEVNDKGVVTAVGGGNAAVVCYTQDFASAICNIVVIDKNEIEGKPTIPPAPRPAESSTMKPVASPSPMTKPNSTNSPMLTTKPDLTVSPRPTNGPNIANIPLQETVLKDSKNIALYKVLAQDKTVAFYQVCNKTATKIVVPVAVTINGVKYRVTAISDNAFNGCNKLQSVAIGRNVISIGNKVFNKCKKIKKIVIPTSVEKIGKKAFYGCKNLKTIIIMTNKLKSKSVGSLAFKGIHKKAIIRVPKKQKKAYTKWLRKKGVTKKMRIK